VSSSRFDPGVYAHRLRAAAAATADAGLAGLVITPGYDLRYLVGSRAQTYERLTALVIPVSGEPSVVVPRLELASLKDSAIVELGLPVRDWVDGEDPYNLVLAALGGGPVATAVTDAMPALHLLPLTAKLDELPMLATDVLRPLRMIKDQAEIDALRKAGAAIDRVHARVPEFLVPGRTEADVAADINEAMVAEGHSEVAFVIVGSGPHGADPHHEVSDRELRAGDIVVVDIGGPYEPGYNSDSTRTYSLGEPSPEVAQQYSILQRAQRTAVQAVRPGVTAGQVDAAARDVLADAGLAEYFVHRTGHGIGLSVHEEPYIVAGNDLPLAPGMAFSVEPGIYFPGRWGARIEDIVVVTSDGAEPLNHRPHELIVVPVEN
jgi:Xaa-Pro aminopeptidase